MCVTVGLTSSEWVGQVVRVRADKVLVRLSRSVFVYHCMNANTACKLALLSVPGRPAQANTRVNVSALMSSHCI
jgi:hypothetical protein